jgi:SpoU rRNA methylase family enzyme
MKPSNTHLASEKLSAIENQLQSALEMIGIPIPVLEKIKDALGALAAARFILANSSPNKEIDENEIHGFGECWIKGYDRKNRSHFQSALMLWAGN